MIRVVVACAGHQNKWQNHTGRPSHLVLVPGDGRPLLARTVAQVRRYATDVHVTAPPGDWRYRMAGAVVHERSADEPSEYASTRALWNDAGRTALLLGDVFWSDAALQRVLTDPARDFRVYGRYGPSRITGTPYGEIFAAAWWPAQHARLDALLEQVHAARAAGTITRPPGWMLLRAWCGLPMNRHRVKRPPFCDLDDWTDDVDTAADYERHPAFRGGAGARR